MEFQNLVLFPSNHYHGNALLVQAIYNNIVGLNKKVKKSLYENEELNTPGKMEGINLMTAEILILLQESLKAKE